MPTVSEAQENINRKRKMGLEPSARDFAELQDAQRKSEGQQSYGLTSSKFSGVLPNATATDSTSVIGQSEHVAKADHVHGIGTHTHLSSSTGGTIAYLLLDASNDPVTGDLLIKPTVDSLTGFVVQDTDANIVLRVDTVNNRVGIGTLAPTYQLEIYSAGGGTGFKVTDTTGIPRFRIANTAGDFAFYVGVNTVNNFCFYNYKTLKYAMVIDSINRVGIGNDFLTPAGRLHVQGGTDDQQLIVQGFLNQVSNVVEIQKSTAAVQISFDDNGGAIFNEAGNDADFRVEGNTATNLLVVDAGLDAVQMGTTVAGAIAEFDATEITFNEASNDVDFRVESNGNANMLIVDGGLDVVSVGAAAVATSTNTGVLQVTAPASVYGISLTCPTGGFGIVSYNTAAESTSSGGVLVLRAGFTPSAVDKRIGFCGAGAITTGTTYVNAAAVTFHSLEAWDGTHAGAYIAIETVPAASTTRAQVVYISNASVVFNDVSADCDFRIESNDEANMFFLDGGNNYIYLGGTTNGIRIDQGGELTLLGTATVYNDANVGSLVLQTGGTLPGIVEWLNNAGGATGIYGRGFAINEQGSGSIEIPHDYDEGTDLTFHVHWGANDAPSGTDYVKWQLKYSITRGEATFPASTTIVIETAYDTQYELKRSDFPAITGTNFLIGDQFNFTLTRIAAAGDAFAGEALVESLGFHYACDTMGSKTITAK